MRHVLILPCLNAEHSVRMCDSFLITGHIPVKCSYTQSLPTSTANKDIRLFEYSS